MVMLVERLEGWAITKARGDDVTVVFERPPSTAIPSSVVEVAHAPKAAANSADDEIVRLVRSGAQPQEIRVVTSDKALTDRVRDLVRQSTRQNGSVTLSTRAGRTRPAARSD